MGLTWKGGRNPQKLKLQVKEAGDDIKARARLALELSLEEGAEALRQYLEAAETATGVRRVARGGESSGRHETGNMVNKVSHNGTRPIQMGAMITGSFGWFSGEFESYFRDQDEGAGNIPAARALYAAFIVARENFRRRMKQVADGKTPTR